MRNANSRSYPTNSNYQLGKFCTNFKDYAQYNKCRFERKKHETDITQRTLNIWFRYPDEAN